MQIQIGDKIVLKSKTIIITEKLSDNDYRYIDNHGIKGFFNKRVFLKNT